MSIRINDALIPGHTTRSSAQSGAPDTRLRGLKLILARVAWLVVVTMIVANFLARLPAYYIALQTVCTGGMATCGSAQPTPYSALALQKLGLSVSAYAAIILALTIALAFVCFTLGAVIFWRRSDDWMALLVALAVVVSATLNGGAALAINSAWLMLTVVLFVLGSSVYVLVLALFPDGRFVPRWMRWLLLCWPIAVFVSFRYLGYDLVWHTAIVLLVIAQVYRYRTAASPRQRQQGKWLLYGGSVAGIIIVGLTVPPFLFPSLGQAGSFYQLVSLPVYIVISFTLPLCFGIAILRYRLYDIDLIIRRTLVYSTLTVVLAVIYDVSLFTLQSLLSSLTLIGGNQLAIVASTFLIGGLFKPVHDRTRALIDHRFYRRKYDAARTIAAFSATIRDEVDLKLLCSKLVAVVDETMQPAHISLWLCAPKRTNENLAGTFPTINTVGKP